MTRYVERPPPSTLPIRGITFVELLMTMLVIVVISVFAAPYFRNMLMDKRMMAERDMLVTMLNYARSTALTQNTTVQACPVGQANSATCGSNWQTGFMIISQPPTGAAVLLQSYRAGPNDPTLSTVAIGGVSAASINFDARGITTTQANFKLCDSRGGASALSVQVLPTGMVQTSETPGTAIWNGGALTCP